ncbi:hypothetical protein N665_0209s0055 [Sinapis alba]|nr:hypothetical protein N665_0209s0055 [Sinapis alba]
MAKKKKPTQSSDGANPTGSTDLSPSSQPSAPNSLEIAAISPSASKTNELPGIASSPAITATVDLQISVDSEVSSAPLNVANPNSQIAATSEIVPAHVNSSQIADENTPPPPLATGKNPIATGTQEQDKVAVAAQFWKGYIKPSAGKLEPEGTPFTLDSGEACVTIPNSVIEKNRKAWDSFIVGQFYEEPPARGAVHAIVNGIWSKQRRDISVSKMEGGAFLFRVPCPHARRRILSQCLWQIDGQTMFVAKWSPGTNQEKPELSAIPIWLDFFDVPLQFFNKDALKEIAGLVGKPLYLHPSTENLTNLEVAKVYTVIDPRKPLPEAVNARFESGEIRRIRVSSPWLPAVCGHCLKVGHTISRCSLAPRICTSCRSAKHKTEDCPRSINGVPKDKTQRDKPPKEQVPKDKATKDKGPIQSQLPLVGDPLKQKQVGDPPSLPSHNEEKTASPSKPLKQKQVFAEFKSNLHIASSSGTRSPSIPQPFGPSRSIYKPPSPSLKEGSLCVDLSSVFLGSPTGSPELSEEESSSGSELPSEDDDNPNDEGDKYIRVVSRKIQKQLKGKSKDRARGPLNL